MRDALAAWGPLTVVGPLAGGNRNTVLELRRGEERLVARQSQRSPASLGWEVELLDQQRWPAALAVPGPAAV
jgi:hypothetical protein